MRITEYGIELKVSAATLVAQQGDTMLAAPKAVREIETTFAREAEGVYLVSDSDEKPALLVEWKYCLSEADQYDLLHLTCSPCELRELYRMGVL